MRGLLLNVGVLLALGAPSLAPALSPDPFPFPEWADAPLSLQLHRVERPDFYWANLGVPAEFFQDVSRREGGVPDVRGIVYGLRVGARLLPSLHLSLALPVESRAFTDASGEVHKSARAGDLVLGTSWSLVGARGGRFHVALDGWAAAPTGTSPFRLEYPLLATGRGTWRGAGGVEMEGRTGGFSLWLGLHYESPFSSVEAPARLFGAPGTFEWPDLWHGRVRLAFDFHRRSFRRGTLFYEARLRAQEETRFEGAPVASSDRVLFSAGGVEVRVDPEWTVWAEAAFFPAEPDFFGSRKRPAFGTLWTLGAAYRP